MTNVAPETEKKLRESWAEQQDPAGRVPVPDKSVLEVGEVYDAVITEKLGARPFDTIKSWMGENDKLAVYQHYFDNLFRQKAHILGPREEELMAMSGQVRRVPYNAYNLLTNADLKFPTIKDDTGETVELSDSAFYLFMRSPDRQVRKNAYEGIVGTGARFARCLIDRMKAEGVRPGARSSAGADAELAAE